MRLLFNPMVFLILILHQLLLLLLLIPLLLFLDSPLTIISSDWERKGKVINRYYFLLLCLFVFYYPYYLYL